MAVFLNTKSLNEWIPKLINETERELMIIVPYIKTSARVFEPLCEANKRGVETTLIFRENKLSEAEITKLKSLDNLNLMHHPNIHCKCYYNEKYLIITSMNLYEYSEENNREMGILLHREELEPGFDSSADPESLFQDAIKEIQAIINGSHLEKYSRETETEGFEMDIIKTKKDKAEELCKVLKKVFIHKRFVVQENNGNYLCTCHHYFDRINVSLEHRVVIDLDFPEKKREDIFNRFLPYYHEYRIDGFKLYWNYHNSSIYLYRNVKHKIWEGLENKDEARYLLIKNGIDQFIVFIRPFL